MSGITEGKTLGNVKDSPTSSPPAPQGNKSALLEGYSDYKINTGDVVSMADSLGLTWNCLKVIQIGVVENGMQWILYAPDIKTILYVTSYTTLRKTM